MLRTIAVMALVTFAAYAILAPVAMGADVSRAEYVEQSEPICKVSTLASEKSLKGVRKDVREGRLKLAGGKFKRAAKALSRATLQLEKLPRPSADESRLARWLVHLNGETKLLEKVAARLKQGSTKDLGRYVVELQHKANVANNIVLTFGFEYCLLQPARYL